MSIKKEKNKRGCCGNFLWLFILAGIFSIFSPEEGDDDKGNKKPEIKIISNTSTGNIGVDNKKTDNETEKIAESKENHKEDIRKTLSNHFGEERSDILCEILFTELGFKKVRFIKKIEGTFNYEIWIEDQKSMITDMGDDFRIFIPNTNIVFYENGEVLMDADELSSRTIDPHDINSYYIIAKSIIESNLKNPSSAKFPSYSTNASSIKINKLDDLICVQSYVDATNSFNAKIRTDWVVQFTVFDLDSFFYEENYIQIGDDAAGEFISMD